MAFLRQRRCGDAAKLGDPHCTTMASQGDSETDNGASFSFGEMALSAEPGRGTPGAISSLGGLRPDSAETAAETLLRKMRKVMINEEFSPDILQFATLTVEGIQNLVSAQTGALDDVEFGDSDTSVGFETHIKRMELDRINYLLRSYYRVRIKKIEKIILFIFKDQDTFDKLSKAEQEFAISYMNLVEGHFNRSFLSMLPEKLRKLDKDGNVDHAVPPELDRFVFCRMKRTLGSYAVSEEPTDPTIYLEDADIVVTRYSKIRDMLKDETAELI